MGNESFKLGEIAVFQNLPFPFSRFNGDECEIVRELALTDIYDLNGNFDTTHVYQVSHRGSTVAVKPYSLKKRRKPDSKDADFGKVVQWGDCAWSPEQVSA